MIYPKGVRDFIARDSALCIRFKEVAEQNRLNTAAGPTKAIQDDFELWMIREGYRKSDEIRKYLFFLSVMLAAFKRIHHFFEKQNPGREDKKDACAVATSPEEMMYITRYLYYLDSYAIPGDVLECGCFKGFSSCCLSWACQYLGRRLIIADSFEGLPEEKNHSYYEKHDFKGEFGEVASTIAALGRVDCVEFIKGWYNQSLVGFNRPLALLWMDVDLYQSGRDVLYNVAHNLSPGGVIFSHEFSPTHTRNNEIIPASASATEVTQAIYEYLCDQGRKHKAKFLKNNTGLVIPDGEGNILLSRRKQTLLQNVETIHEQGGLPPLGTLKSHFWDTPFHLDTIDGIVVKNEGKPIPVANDEIVLSGWAIDKNADAPAGGVYAEIDGQAYSGYCGFDRPDVAEALHKPAYRYSGFEVVVPTAGVRKGRQSLTLRILTKDFRGYYNSSRKLELLVE